MRYISIFAALLLGKAKGSHGKVSRVKYFILAKFHTCPICIPNRVNGTGEHES